MQFIVLSIASIVLAFVVINGVLMCVSPMRFHAFLRWYTSLRGNRVFEVKYGARVQLRLAGLIVVLISLILIYQLCEKSFGILH